MPRSLGRISGGEISQSIIGRWKPKRIGQVLRSVPCLARCLSENNHLLALMNQPLHKRDDPVTMFAFVVKRPDESLHSKLPPGITVQKAEAPVVAHNPFIERHGPLERDDLWLQPIPPSHSQQRQNELQVCPPTFVRDHLNFVDNDCSDLFEYVRVCQRYRGELLVSEQRDVVSPAQ